AAHVKGLTNADSYYAHQKWYDAVVKTIYDYEPDIFMAEGGGSGDALSLLGPKLLKWPGNELASNNMHQTIEGEPLKAEEYNMILSDPSDWTLRYYLPRTWMSMKSLSKLPSLQSLWGATALPMLAARFADPDVSKAFEVLAQAGKKQQEIMGISRQAQEDIISLGFPPFSHGRAPAPFDVVSDHLRGMAGTMMDMFRHPDELLQLCTMLLAKSIEMGAETLNNPRGNPKRVWSALHRGSDGFMSLKQFETFYWTDFKKLVLTMIDMGLVHVPFYEGNWEQRLEYLLDFPKGKTIARFALTDLKRAKEVLKDHTCIMGGVPHSLLQTASPSEVEEYVKKLIETVGKGGGFILTASTGLTNEAKPENVRAMVDAARKYGRY
ncbi:uroporphyrinogen decarboxylase family protein, partial [Chloroflexota bacterium]